MALSDTEVEAIHLKEFGYVATGLGQFARAIEAEVRKADDVLILQLVEALGVATTPLAKDRQEVLRAITAARARLGGET